MHPTEAIYAIEKIALTDPDRAMMMFAGMRIPPDHSKVLLGRMQLLLKTAERVLDDLEAGKEVSNTEKLAWQLAQTHTRQKLYDRLTHAHDNAETQIYELANFIHSMLRQREEADVRPPGEEGPDRPGDVDQA